MCTLPLLGLIDLFLNVLSAFLFVLLFLRYRNTYFGYYKYAPSFPLLSIRDARPYFLTIVFPLPGLGKEERWGFVGEYASHTYFLFINPAYASNFLNNFFGLISHFSLLIIVQIAIIAGFYL